MVHVNLSDDPHILFAVLIWPIDKAHGKVVMMRFLFKDKQFLVHSPFFLKI